MSQSSRPTGHSRPAFALVEVLVAGVVLAIGIAVVVSVSSQSLANQRRGEFAVAAAAILDELLGEVLLTGPDEFGAYKPLSGGCEDPWQDFSYEVVLEAPESPMMPYDVTAIVTDPLGRKHSCATRIAVQPELLDDERDRRPDEPMDREARHDELEEQAGG